MENLDQNLCGNIIVQVNHSDLETTIFTDQIGGDKGTRGRSCGSCFNRLWDWLCGVSYNKNSVTNRINTAFRSVQLHGLEKGSLQTFKENLEALQNKFNKQGTLKVDLQETIKKIDAYLSKDIRARERSKKRVDHKEREPAAAQVKPPKARHNTKSTQRAQSTRVKQSPHQLQAQQIQNEEFLINISAREGTHYLEVLKICYGDSSRYIEKVTKWIEDTYEEIHQSLGAGIGKPLDEDKIRIQFETILGQKILQYNLDKLSKKIPDLFTNDTYRAERITDWLPGTGTTGPLGQFMTVVPFSNETIKHIRIKLKENSSPQRAEVKEKREEPTLEKHIKELMSQSDTQILGLPDQGFTRDNVVKSYRKLALKFHPDKLSSQPLLEQKRGSETFSRMSRAYANLIRYEDFYDSQIKEGFPEAKAREFTHAFTYAFTYVLGKGLGETVAQDEAFKYVVQIKQSTGKS